ncbi:MAG: L-glutamate gamma-semialdehyde dehydrogenase [Acidobacteria bacterium]|nr:L-glutamate gamma-semialdehyde dehydrogenase [Acidobacteriota bacterium]
MNNARVTVPPPRNEPVLSYAPGSPEKAALKAQLDAFAAGSVEIPLIIGGREVTTGDLGACVLPHDYRKQVATYHRGNADTVDQAIAAAAAARPGWSEMSWESRAAIFLKAAELLAGRYRPIVNAATMLNQSKTVFQAEIDAACELIDFWRFNVSYLPDIYGQQPESAAGIWNYVEYRALEGFVLAVTPFNFTSIAGNLPTSPALMGNTVLWKPASTAVFSAYWLMKLLEEAGLPPGVINLVPGSGGQIGGPAMAHPDLGGVHFTGSTEVFQDMWRTVGGNIAGYRSYPRIVGETGGKDFVFAHASADPDELTANLIRGAYEYQGQKCSAASRAYVPESLWNRCRDEVVGEVGAIRYGDVTDFTNFMGAVIDKASFDKQKRYIDAARTDSDADVICGGVCDDSTGYFISPTIIQAHDPRYATMETELFGPVLTVHVYKDSDYEQTLDLCDRTSPYALTGAIFGRDRRAIGVAHERLRHAAGNFYINDKPTGAVVGQQPFGGSRASGTNDKAGSAQNLLRWVSTRTTKETFVPVRDYRYPHMQEK